VELIKLDEKDDQEKVAQVVEKHDLTLRETQSLVRTVKTAPEPLKQAILKGKVDPMEAVKAAEVIKSAPRKVSDEEVKVVVNDMEKHQKAEKRLAEVDRADRDEFIKKGPKKGLPRHLQLEYDQQVGRIEQIAKELPTYCTSTYVSTIRNQDARMRAFKVLQKMTDHLERELMAIQERTWFKTGHLAGDDDG
jgi:hypothetical protein